MALRNYNELSDFHLDALREIGNIGSGNAATALADMLASPVDIQVPVVRIMDYNEVTEELGGVETMVVGLLLALDGDMQGMIMFLMEQDFADMTLSALLGEPPSGLGTLEEMGYSTLKEVANIMAASYVNAIASMTGMTIQLSVPAVCIDMLGSIMSVPAIHYANISDKLILIQDQFSSSNINAANHILLIPDVDSLEKMMGMLGIEL